MPRPIYVAIVPTELDIGVLFRFRIRINPIIRADPTVYTYFVHAQIRTTCHNPGPDPGSGLSIYR